MNVAVIRVVNKFYLLMVIIENLFFSNLEL